MRPNNETVLWTADRGVRCVLNDYDETRVQLRLLRPQGTVRAAVFSDQQAARSVANEWRADLERVSRDLLDAWSATTFARR